MMICVPIVATTMEQALRDMREASARADIIELRIDYLHSNDLGRLLAERSRPVIVTNRRQEDGGKHTGTEEARLSLLREAIRLGAEYVDVEVHSAAKMPAERGRTKLIVSHHDFNETPKDLPSLWTRISEAGADVVKIATHARDLGDNLRVFDLLASSTAPTVAFCMGELGIISRILAPKYGSFYTFASLRKGSESAPGQLTLDEMEHIYRVRRIRPASRIYGVMGDPVAHSISPHIHNCAFEHLNIEAVYVPFMVEDPGRFLRELRSQDVWGLSVTIPHKQAIMAELDEIESAANLIGAVNTVVRREDRLIGFNTEWRASVEPVERAIAARTGRREVLKDMRVSILGAGGAARAAAYGFGAHGAKVTILNRTAERAKALAKDVRCKWHPWEERGAVPADIIVNATSVGMSPHVDETPYPAEYLREGLVVFDIVYNPLQTRLLREAEGRGCLTVSGLEMFIAQAAGQFELWTQTKAPEDLMRRTALAQLATG